MGEHTRRKARQHDGRPSSLGELIHVAVRRAIEVAVDEELTAALGAWPYERGVGRCGYRNGTKPRTLAGPTGPLALTVPRASLFTPTGDAAHDQRDRAPERGVPTTREDPGRVAH